MTTGAATVTLRVGDEIREGRAVDLGDLSVAPERVAAAVRADGNVVAAPDERAVSTGPGRAETVSGVSRADAGTAGDPPDGVPLAVDCPDPRPVHEHVGCVRPGLTVRVRTALAAAARSRGGDAPQDDELRDVREELADLTVPSPPDLRAARERLAGTDDAVDRIRERVAALRGRLQAGRAADRDVSDIEAELAEATRELSERETERAAAREALDRAEQRARESRDARERRRRLEDRAANLERRARRHLVERIRDEYAAAVADVPGASEAARVAPFDAGPVTAALAVGRVAAVRAPVVVACDRFETAGAAADWLDAPVVRV